MSEINDNKTKPAEMKPAESDASDKRQAAEHAPNEGMTLITDTRGVKHEVDTAAWDRPGHFAVQRDENERTTRIEGWLSPTHEERGTADAALQRDVVKQGGQAEMHGGHLIAHSLGGPGVESHGEEIARANLVPMTERMNNSYVGNHEAAIGKYIEENPDKQFYMQVDVRHLDAIGATIVTHRVFERDQASGKISKVDGLSECDTWTSANPSDTRAKAVKAATGHDGHKFSTPTDKGTLRSIHGPD